MANIAKYIDKLISYFLSTFYNAITGKGSVYFKPAFQKGGLPIIINTLSPINIDIYNENPNLTINSYTFKLKI